MAKVTIHHDRLSRYSSLGMILLGVITFPFSGFFGIILIVIGLAMYWLYRRQSRYTRASRGSKVKRAPVSQP